MTFMTKNIEPQAGNFDNGQFHRRGKSAVSLRGYTKTNLPDFSPRGWPGPRRGTRRRHRLRLYAGFRARSGGEAAPKPGGRAPRRRGPRGARPRGEGRPRRLRRAREAEPPLPLFAAGSAHLSSVSVLACRDAAPAAAGPTARTALRLTPPPSTTDPVGAAARSIFPAAGGTRCAPGWRNPAPPRRHSGPARPGSAASARPAGAPAAAESCHLAAELTHRPPRRRGGGQRPRAAGEGPAASAGLGGARPGSRGAERARGHPRTAGQTRATSSSRKTCERVEGAIKPSLGGRGFQTDIFIFSPITHITRQRTLSSPSPCPQTA